MRGREGGRRSGRDEDPASVTATAFSRNGRFTAHRSDADLVPGDDHTGSGTYLFDRAARAAQLINVLPSGRLFSMSFVEISDDGRTVVFQSSGGPLQPVGEPTTLHTYLLDLRDGTVSRVSVDCPLASNPGRKCSGSAAHALSADGRFVAYQASRGVYILDRITQELTVIEVGSAYIEALALSPDGSLIAMNESIYATGPGNLEVFDRATRTRLYYDAAGYSPSLSNDAVAYTAGGYGYVAEVSTGVKTPVSKTPAGTVRRLASRARIAADGAHVAFHACATDIVPGDTTSECDVYRYTRATDTNEIVSLDAAGTQLVAASSPHALRDGETAFWAEGASYVRGFDRWDPDPPHITEPRAMEIIRTPSTTVSGLAPPGSTVRLFDGAGLVGSTTAAADRSWSIPITTPPETSLTIHATAETGGTTSIASSPRTFLTAEPFSAPFDDHSVLLQECDIVAQPSSASAAMTLDAQTGDVSTAVGASSSTSYQGTIVQVGSECHGVGAASAAATATFVQRIPIESAGRYKLEIRFDTATASSSATTTTTTLSYGAAAGWSSLFSYGNILCNPACSGPTGFAEDKQVAVNGGATHTGPVTFVYWLDMPPEANTLLLSSGLRAVGYAAGRASSSAETTFTLIDYTLAKVP